MKKIIQTLGPGIITAALVLGPGSLTITTKLGANFGFQLLWVVGLVVIGMLVYTAMATRIGLASQVSLIQLIRQKYGKGITLILAMGIFLATTAFQTGNAVGAGAAIGGLSETDISFWIVFFALAACSLLFLPSFYKILERLMIGLVILMAVSFLLTLALSQPNLSELMEGLIPRIPDGAELLTLALIASSFSTIGAFYQSYLVREKGWSSADTKGAILESRIGIVLLGLLTGTVMLCAGTILYGQSIPVNSPSDLGLALEPLFGNLASDVFMVGFFAASFSSILGNATIGGAILSDALGLGHNLRDKNVRGLIILVILTGATIAFFFGKFPLELIIFAQSVTIFIGPPIAVILLLIGNSSSIMGDLKNNSASNIIALLGLVVLLFLAGYHFYSLIS